jgi:hypothetical protein
MVSADKDREFQLLIWGYAIEGDVTEHDAMLAEEGGKYRTLWDRTRRQLDSARIDRGRGWEPVPDWWALNYLPMEWREQQHAAEEEKAAARCVTCNDAILYEYYTTKLCGNCARCNGRGCPAVRWRTCPTCGFGPGSTNKSLQRTS